MRPTTKLNCTLLVLFSISGATAITPASAVPQPGIYVSYPNKSAAFAAIKEAKEIIPGDVFKDSQGCLYGVGTNHHNLALKPILIDGTHICSKQKGA